LGVGPGTRALRIPPGRDIGREKDLLRDSTGFPQDEAVPAGDRPVAPTGDGRRVPPGGVTPRVIGQSSKMRKAIRGGRKKKKGLG